MLLCGRAEASCFPAPPPRARALSWRRRRRRRHFHSACVPDSSGGLSRPIIEGAARPAQAEIDERASRKTSRRRSYICVSSLSSAGFGSAAKLALIHIQATFAVSFCRKRASERASEQAGRLVGRPSRRALEGKSLRTDHSAGRTPTCSLLAGALVCEIIIRISFFFLLLLRAAVQWKW